MKAAEISVPGTQRPACNDTRADKLPGTLVGSVEAVVRLDTSVCSGPWVPSNLLLVSSPKSLLTSALSVWFSFLTNRTR